MGGQGERSGGGESGREEEREERRKGGMRGRVVERSGEREEDKGVERRQGRKAVHKMKGEEVRYGIERWLEDKGENGLQYRIAENF